MVYTGKEGVRGRPVSGYYVMKIIPQGREVFLPESVRSVIVFDGECALCNRCVRLVLRVDRKRQLRICSRSSEIGRRLLEMGGSAVTSIDSIVVISRAGTHTQSDAVLELAGVLGFPYSICGIFRVVPRSVRDRIYAVIARNRYRWFGRVGECALIPLELRDRFLEGPL